MEMESVFAAGAGAGAGASQLLRPRVTPQIPIALKLSAAADKAPFGFRFKKNVLNLQIRERWQAVSASKSNLPDGDSIEDKSGRVKSGDAPQGPPFLTILAGFLVLLLVFWILGSILTWLISFFVRN
ncbi:hypothetical protein RchiOBHm_Chr1g0313281 [Rosa chinensis]|uniref:Uncharacterized protein n=1 Tax=Rosa chinensis TaxID=74649 RepID=A0A2P6S6U2_ROSCH|nr:uncharacterized protein LOC112176506 [Rosa chinensis]PRQ54410.1 hypothetical protein RchiOBHm_Chr1g0313281 [Rosa chinensis]